MPKHHRMTDEDFDWHIKNRLCVECDRPLGLDDTNPPKTVRHGVCARNVIPDTRVWRRQRKGGIKP